MYYNVGVGAAPIGWPAVIAWTIWTVWLMMMILMAMPMSGVLDYRRIIFVEKMSYRVCEKKCLIIIGEKHVNLLLILFKSYTTPNRNKLKLDFKLNNDISTIFRGAIIYLLTWDIVQTGIGGSELQVKCLNKLEGRTFHLHLSSIGN